MKFNCSTELPSAHIYFPLMSLEWLERQLMEVSPETDGSYVQHLDDALTILSPE